MYIDPTFGGILLQVLVALVATGGAIVFAMRRKIKVLFSKGKSDENASNVLNATDSAIDASDDDAVDMLSDEIKNKNE